MGACESGCFCSPDHAIKLALLRAAHRGLGRAEAMRVLCSNRHHILGASIVRKAVGPVLSTSSSTTHAPGLAGREYFGKDRARCGISACVALCRTTRRGG